MTLLTEWGERLDPDEVLPEYPRSQLVRGGYLNLNGRWEYAVAPREPEAFDGGIIVPSSPESPLSGVNRRLLPGETLWYRREFDAPDGPTRTVDHASGWHDQGAGDLRSIHVYFRRFRVPRRRDGRVLVLSGTGCSPTTGRCASSRSGSCAASTGASGCRRHGGRRCRVTSAGGPPRPSR
ncbi:hypothetical protein ACFHW3_32680, partial [Actinomadura sp. LOL_011]